MQNNNIELVPIQASELIKKCRCHEDLVNFCREIGKENSYNILSRRKVFSTMGLWPQKSKNKIYNFVSCLNWVN